MRVSKSRATNTTKSTALYKLQELLRIAQGNWMLAEEEKKRSKGGRLGLLYLLLAYLVALSSMVQLGRSVEEQS